MQKQTILLLEYWLTVFKSIVTCDFSQSDHIQINDGGKIFH